MSVRGPRGGRGRGNGRARGRGRATTWEWHNNYSPGPEIYNQLWHIRKEPAIVTPFLPTACPVRNAQSRIMDRRQTEGAIQRNFYVVQVKHSQSRETSSSTFESDQQGISETLHVDLSRILDYVSPDELERFENGQFRIETEAEAAVLRAYAEELVQKRLQKNIRAAATGHGHGLQDAGEARSRGRPRGRGRGRGRGSWRGTSTLAESSRLLSEGAHEELVHVELEEGISGDEELINLDVAETGTDPDSEDADELARSSPVIARSAFVANSALPVSPILMHRRSLINHQTLPDEGEESSNVESDVELEDADNRSMSSAAMQLRIEHNTREHSDVTSDGGDLHNQPKSKRRRTDSTTSDLPASFAKAALVDSHHSDSMSRRVSPVPETSSDTESSDSDNPDTSDQRRPVPIPPANHSLLNRSAEDMESASDQAHMSDAETRHEHAGEGEEQDAEEYAEEYAVENIMNHYREAGKTFFLVKWEGFEDSHDWLPEEDLEGASELVAEYKHRLLKREGKRIMK